jgi:hypothetical protein
LIEIKEDGGRYDERHRREVTRRGQRAMDMMLDEAIKLMR